MENVELVDTKTETKDQTIIYKISNLPKEVQIRAERWLEESFAIIENKE